MKKTKLQFHISILTLVLLWTCQGKTDKTSSVVGLNTITNLMGKEVPVDSINVFLNRKMKQMNIHGLSFAIINGGQVAYYLTKGYADLEEKTDVTGQTLFEGASTSKAVFAYMTMFLVEEGKLDLDRPLYEYLAPNLQGIYNYDDRYKQITARMVLSHTTGFPNWRGNDELTIQFDPGSNFSYSGEGYQFLVRSIESILDTNYIGLEEYYQKKVAIPLDMKYTKFVQGEYNLKNKASPYNEGKKMELNQWTSKEFNAASAIHTEAIDFSKWLVALMNGKGLSKDSYYQLFSDQITVSDAPTIKTEEGAIAWTLGFAKYNIDGHVVYGHEGNNDGFNALFLMDRNKKWAMVQFNNANEVYDFGFDVFRYINK